MKTVCIYHSIDLDGFMSAAIVKHWFKENNNGFIKDTENNFCDFIGYNYGQPIPDLSGYDRVIMCDISFPKDEMINIAKRIGLNFIWLDHHISAINSFTNSDMNGENYYPNGIRNTNYAACELTWKYFFPNEPMPQIVRLLGRWDNMINAPITDKIKWLKITEFQYGARACISNYEEAYDTLLKDISSQNNVVPEWFEILHYGESIYKYLCIEAKQSYKNGFEIKFLHNYLTNNQAISETVKFICINKERFNPINFGIDYHKDGYDGAACFWYENGMFNFSLYNDNGNVDCSIIAKQYNGGGHKGDAGMKLTHEQFNNLLKK